MVDYNVLKELRDNNININQIIKQKHEIDFIPEIVFTNQTDIELSLGLIRKIIPARSVFYTYPNGIIKCLKPSQDITLVAADHDLVFKQKSLITFYHDGTIMSGSLGANVQFKYKQYTIPIKKGSILFFDKQHMLVPEKSLLYASTHWKYSKASVINEFDTNDPIFLEENLMVLQNFSKNQMIAHSECYRSKYYDNGCIKEGYLYSCNFWLRDKKVGFKSAQFNENFISDPKLSAHCFPEITFHKNGSVKTGILAENTKFKRGNFEFIVKGESKIELDNHGNIITCKLAEDAEYKYEDICMTIPANSELAFRPSDVLFAVGARTGIKIRYKDKKVDDKISLLPYNRTSGLSMLVILFRDNGEPAISMDGSVIQYANYENQILEG